MQCFHQIFAEVATCPFGIVLAPEVTVLQHNAIQIDGALPDKVQAKFPVGCGGAFYTDVERLPTVRWSYFGDGGQRSTVLTIDLYGEDTCIFMTAQPARKMIEVPFLDGDGTLSQMALPPIVAAVGQ